MKEPTEDLLLAYGRVAWGYNQVRTAQSIGQADKPEYLEIRDQLKKDRVELEVLQRKYDDPAYTHR